jgi:hypothetical protein
MKRLIRLYPARWRRRYGSEMDRLLDDMGPLSARARLSVAFDLVRGAWDAHLTHAPSRATLGRAVLVALVVWVGLTVEIVRSNVIFPSAEDNDGLSVVVSYLAVFAALALTGAIAADRSRDWRTFAVAGAVAGGLIGALTIISFAVVDNVFLDIVAQQQVKIEGLARSGGTSMRTYVNGGLAVAFVVLTGFFAVAGAGLAVLGGITRSLRTRPTV